MSNNRNNNGARVKLRDVFRALRHRNYRLFFMGQGLSLVGTWVQAVAVGWLVYSLSHSALMLGVVGFSSQIAAMLLSPFAGVWVASIDCHPNTVYMALPKSARSSIISTTKAWRVGVSKPLTIRQLIYVICWRIIGLIY